MDARPALTSDRLARFAARLDVLAPDGKVGVAVSGGPDSLALLLLSNAVRPHGIIAARRDAELFMKLFAGV